MIQGTMSNVIDWILLILIASANDRATIPP